MRECARQQGVSPHTVVAAYDQLLAQGLVEARRQRGFYVRDAVREPARPDDGIGARAAGVAVAPPSGRLPADASSLIRGMFHRQSDKPQPGMGVFPPDWMDSTFMPTALRRLTGTRALQELSLQYGEPAGDTALRRSLSQKLAGIDVDIVPGVGPVLGSPVRTAAVILGASRPSASASLRMPRRGSPRFL